jgi:hypothetical protein
LTLLETAMFVMLVQPENAPSSMEVTLLRIARLLILAPANA